MKPLYRCVEQYIRERIDSGELIPGDLIPSESQLANTLHVSVGTVRKAVDILVHQRLLYRHQGKGTYVSRIDFNNSLFRFFTYGTHTGEDIRIQKETPVRKNIKGPKEICSKLGVRANSKLTYIERIGYSEDQPILLEKSWWVPNAVPALQDDATHIPDLLYAVVEDKLRVPVVRAEETLTAESADKKTASILHVNVGDPIVVLMRLTFSVNDKPIEYRVTNGRADKFSYKTEIR